MTSIYQYDDAEMLHVVNKTLGVVVEGLQKEGFLTEDQASNIHTNYSVIIENKYWVPDFLAKWLGIEGNNVKLRLVKAIGRVKDK